MIIKLNGQLIIIHLPFTSCSFNSIYRGVVLFRTSAATTPLQLPLKEMNNFIRRNDKCMTYIVKSMHICIMHPWDYFVRKKWKGSRRQENRKSKAGMTMWRNEWVIIIMLEIALTVSQKPFALLQVQTMNEVQEDAKCNCKRSRFVCTLYIMRFS